MLSNDCRDDEETILSMLRSCKAEHQICSENTQPYKEGKAVLPFFTR
ncbi:hypothetical protein BN1184_AR_01310 [Pantoea ananatis]|nr:hypothetical protein BN1184_AR_01310 [Pantoea ananatis]